MGLPLTPALETHLLLTFSWNFHLYGSTVQANQKCVMSETEDCFGPVLFFFGWFPSIFFQWDQFTYLIYHITLHRFIWRFNLRRQKKTLGFTFGHHLKLRFWMECWFYNSMRWQQVGQKYFRFHLRLVAFSHYDKQMFTFRSLWTSYMKKSLSKH